MNTIDLLAIIPYYLELPTRILALTSGNAEGAAFDASFLRVMRLIRIARVLKVQVCACPRRIARTKSMLAMHRPSQTCLADFLIGNLDDSCDSSFGRFVADCHLQ